MKLRTPLRRLTLAVAAALGLVPAPAGEALRAEEPARKARVLYVTTAAGFSHSSRHLSKKVLEEIGKRSGLFDVVFDPRSKVDGKDNTRDEEALKHVTPDGLKQFDAVFFYTTGGKDQFPLSPENRQALIDFVKGGKAFVGFHSATDTYADWEPYRNMIGASFDGHPWSEEVKIDVEDPSHPAAVHLGDSWTINDEIYQMKDWSRSDVHVVLSLNPSSEKGKGKRADKDNSIAWCKRFGEGRVFYTALGHREEVWQDPAYQAHVLGGILWALGRAPGDATPGQPKPSSEWKPLFKDIAACPRSGEGKWQLLADGTLSGSGEAGHIFSPDVYRDFQFRAEVNISEGGNSGMYFRCQDRALWPNGYEAQVNNSHTDKVRTGSLYNRVKIFERLVPPGQPWFRQEVIAVGDHIVIKVNGKVVVDTVDRDFREGAFALQQHDPGSRVQYRNVEVRVLPSPGPLARA